MSNAPKKPDTAHRTQDPLQVFDAAIRHLEQGGQQRSPAQTPIVMRWQAQTDSGSCAKERALTDAARALALLWNVSTIPIR